MATRSFKTWLLAGALVLTGGFTSQASAQAVDGLVVEIGSTTVDLTSSSVVISTSFDIYFFNPGPDPNLLAGYTLFLDIAPATDDPFASGPLLPAGVSFAADPVTYITGAGITGAGVGPLFFAPTEVPGATENLALPPGNDPPNTLAAGDIGLGQFQLFDGVFQPGDRFPILTINLEIDTALATPGSFDLFLNPNGENTISSLTVPAQLFTSTSGTLTLSAIPEPGSLVILAAGGLLVSLRRKRNT